MRTALAIGLAAVLGLGSVARAAFDETDFEVSLSVGYSHLSISGSDRFQERDGVRVEPSVSINPIKALPQLRIGAGLGISGYTNELDNDTVITIDNGNQTTVIFADQWESVSLLQPEFLISWRQRLGDRFYIEPGCGVGVAYTTYAIYNDWWDDEDESESDTTFMVRPFVRAGYKWDHWFAGMEVSYMYGSDINLTDQVHGDLSELFVGGFFGYRF